MRTDPARARELLLGFADLNRAADRPEGTPGTLADELTAVRAYLQIEQARFGPRLQVEIVVDEGLHALPMAPRRVLDAVRAVVQQRIEPRPGGGTVTVTAERAGAGCLVRVAERDGEGRGGEPCSSRRPEPGRAGGGLAGPDPGPGWAGLRSVHILRDRAHVVAARAHRTAAVHMLQRVHERAPVCTGRSRPAEPLTDAGRRRSEVLEVRPRPAHHLPPLRADRVFPQLLGVHDVARLLAGLRSRPYLTLPSNSPTVRCCTQPKSVRPIEHPYRISHCSSGAGSPARAMATRLRDSPTLSLRPSANATARRAAGTPSQPLARRRASVRSGRPSPARSAASATTTACSNGATRAMSTMVRATDVQAIPCTTMISSGRSGAQCTCTSVPRRAPERRRFRVTVTTSNGSPHTDRPCSTAAETWLTTADPSSSGTAHRTCRA